MGRRRPRDAGTRPGDHGRHRQPHRRRRAHPRRRHRLAHAQARPRRSTTCSRPRSSPPTASSSGRRPTSTPTCSGRCAAAAGTSASSPRSVPAAPGRPDRHGRTGVLGGRGHHGGPALLPRLRRRRTRRARRTSSGSARSRRCRSIDEDAALPAGHRGDQLLRRTRRGRRACRPCAPPSSGRHSSTSSHHAVRRPPERLDDTVPHGWHYYWKATNLAGLSDEVIDIVAEHAYDARIPEVVRGDVPHGRRSSRVPRDATAYSGRDVEHNIIIDAAWLPEQDDTVRRCRHRLGTDFFDTLRPTVPAST